MWRKRVLRYLKKPSVCGFGEHAQRQRGDVVPLGTRRIFFFLLLLLFFPLVLLVLSGLVFYFTL